MPAATDEKALIEQIQQGNEAAFTEFVKRYQEKVYWTARRIVGDHDSADDVTQEVFIKVYGALKEFRGEASVFTWLYRITVNVSLNYKRKKRIRNFFSIDELFESPDNTEDLPDVVVEKDETKKLIEEAIQQLPEKQRAVFVMRYYDELTYEEISKILHTSVGGLKANYFHALKKIGVFLKSHGAKTSDI
jgi:RNA polymerase sigma-70 factor (ECF subfamily)